MVSLADGLFGLGILLGVGICWLGYDRYRKRDEPGIAPFAAFTVLFGAGSVAGGVGTLLVEPTIGGGQLWAQVALVALLGWSVPWALFGLQYTGRYTQVRWRTVGLAYLPGPGVLLVALGTERVVDVPQVFNMFVGGLVFIYLFFLLGVGIYLLLQTTYRYGHLSLAQGTSLAAVPVVHFMIVNTSNAVGAGDHALIATLYLLGYALPALALVVALFRYEMFNTTPAIGEIGERTIAQETDDLVFVVDDGGRVIRRNESAVETLQLSRTDSLGAPLEELVGTEVETFRALETVTLETAAGMRQYDPQISQVTDQHGRELGVLLSLRDVTGRELREQRLSVLNRVLRHNLRNRVDVIKSHAEALGDERGDEHVSAIAAAADEITELGYKARTVDQFISESGETQPVDIVDVIEAVRADLDTGDNDIAVTVSGPDTAVVETNRQALEGALESALDNAVRYAVSAVEIGLEPRDDGYEIAVTDDGSGIPHRELASLDAGTETPLQHGTGLGLWQLEWAVTTMGGELSFDTADGVTDDTADGVTDDTADGTTDGTTVRFTVPDQAGDPATPA